MNEIEGLNPDFKSYDSVSAEVKKQIDNVAEIWRRQLGSALTGIYIHGSMALGCFLEGTSDIDILIVCSERIPREKRISIAKEIVELDGKPCPLEMSAVTEGAVKPWRFPTVCQFHYSNYWTERYKKLFSGESNECYVTDNDFEDADIASYIKLILQCGICVCGKPICEVFCDVPDIDFWRGISCDVDDYDFNAYNPEYFSSNILILGRILSYKKVHKILSKYDGGVWAMNYVPERYRSIIKSALETWYGKKEFIQCGEEDSDGLKKFLIDEIKA